MPNFTGDADDFDLYFSLLNAAGWRSFGFGAGAFDRQDYARVVKLGSGKTVAAQLAADRGARIASARPVATRPTVVGVRWTDRGNRAVKNVRRAIRRVPCHPDFSSKD